MKSKQQQKQEHDSTKMFFVDVSRRVGKAITRIDTSFRSRYRCDTIDTVHTAQITPIPPRADSIYGDAACHVGVYICILIGMYLSMGSGGT